ncbi:MAG: hypothetical protein KGL95_15185, partial [Patescibacteria group bacterium]|nr:hypothetical protein [Patescibacteria group bacterium]
MKRFHHLFLITIIAVLTFTVFTIDKPSFGQAANCPVTGCVVGGDTLNVVVTPTTGTSPLTVSYKASFSGSSIMKASLWSFGDGNSASNV